MKPSVPEDNSCSVAVFSSLKLRAKLRPKKDLEETPAGPSTFSVGRDKLPKATDRNVSHSKPSMDAAAAANPKAHLGRALTSRFSSARLGLQSGLRIKKVINDEEKRRSKQATLKMNRAYTYKMIRPFSVLFSWKGTFWPLVIYRYELWLFPAIHTVFVVYGAFHRYRHAENEEGDAPPWENDAEDENGVPPWFGSSHYMLPWVTLGLLTPLMTFFLVFFLGQCYSRFNEFFDICIAIEQGVQEIAMQTLVYVKDERARWDANRYATAAGMIIYFRVVKVADFKEAMVAVSEWERLLVDEKEFLDCDDELWEKMMGWPRTRAEAELYTQRLHTQLDLSAKQPSRLAHAPPLLTREEIDELRKYPGGMMTFVLLTWSMHALREHLPPANMNALMASAAKVRAAAYRVRLMLSMPVPLPYFHSLNMLQNVVRTTLSSPQVFGCSIAASLPPSRFLLNQWLP